MSAPQMPHVNFSCTHIARLLADKLTPDFNFKEQLWYIARADAQEAIEYLCLLLRTQFGFQPWHDHESFFHDCSTDHLGVGHMPFSDIVIESNAKDIARRALVLRDARQRLQNDPSPFLFLQLPLDIRLHVYEFVFINNQVLKSDSDAHYPMADDFKSYTSTGIRTGILGKDINTALLLTNQQIFNEAEPILYRTRFLHIGLCLNGGLEFLRSLSPRARRNIRAVHITLPFFYVDGGHCRLELDNSLEAWCKLCDYMSRNLRIRALSFNAVVEAVPAAFVDAPWVEHLVNIRGLKYLTRCNLDLDDLEWRLNSYDFEFIPEPDPESEMGLNSRLRAFQSYLKSEMLQYPASRLLTEKEEVWDWNLHTRGDWAPNQEPGTLRKVISIP